MTDEQDRWAREEREAWTAFAAAALQGVFASASDGDNTVEDMLEASAEHADAMLAHRRRRFAPSVPRVWGDEANGPNRVTVGGGVAR